MTLKFKPTWLTIALCGNTRLHDLHGWVRIIKVCLSTAITRKIFTYEEFITLVKEAEKIVNSRPITYQSTNTADIPLTPSQLAWGRDLTLVPPLLQSNSYSKVNLKAKAARQQYKILSQALDRFQRRWSTEYLSALREKHNNRCAERPVHHISPGNLIMVCRVDKHRIEWPLGKITCVFPDADGVVRTVEVEEGGQRSTHSVDFIVLLELDCEEADTVNQLDERDDFSEGIVAEEAVTSYSTVAEEAVPGNSTVAEEAVPSDSTVAEEAVPSDSPAAAEAATIELLQSPVLSDIENGDEENESADKQPATKSGGESLPHSSSPPQSIQAPSLELAVTDATLTDTPDPEILQSSAPAHPQRAAAQCQH